MADLYSSLPLGEHCIRILQLAKKPSGEVYATMRVVDLAAQPDYTCLSYTWGAPRWDDTDQAWKEADKHSIIINDHSMKIRPNLQNAMNHLCGILNGKSIWIDAVCINQNSETTGEKNAQVQMMARIYEQATDVVVWLGESSPVWKRAIGNMDRFPLPLDVTKKKLPRGPKVPTLVDIFVTSFHVCQLEDQEQVEIVEFLAGNRWFSRLWTLQEYILGKDVQFLCGDDLVSLETIWKGSALNSLGGLISGAAHIDGDQRDWVRHFSSNVCIENQSSARTEKLSLGTNAHLYRHQQATDQRDKVFGLLGISRKSSSTYRLHVHEATAKYKLETKGDFVNEPFLVDYGLSVQSVFTRAAAYGLLVEQDLHCLSYVGDKNQIEDLPSWVPDFTRDVPWRSFSHPGKDYFKATSEPAAISLDLGKTSALGLQAYPIDSILSTCDAYWDPGAHEMRSPSFFRLLAQPSAPVGYHDEDPASMVLRLVLADGFDQRMDPRKDPEVVETFEKWIITGFPFDEADQARLGTTDSILAFWAKAASQVPEMTQEARAIQRPLLEDLHPIARSSQELSRLLGNPEQREDPDNDHLFLKQWRAACENRCFFRTVHGYVGVGPRTMEVGDQVMLLKGGGVPYILRQQSGEPRTGFNFVGEAYLHGFMFGEAATRHDFGWEGILLY